MADWSREQQQIAALAALCGVLIGALRNTGALPDDTDEQIFKLADGLIPPPAEVLGPEVLSIVRNAARAVGSARE